MFQTTNQVMFEYQKKTQKTTSVRPFAPLLTGSHPTARHNVKKITPQNPKVTPA